jgi:predicted MFS family arabinose efflux permease
VFWPVGNALAEAFGWRGAALAYAGIALLTLPSAPVDAASI